MTAATDIEATLDFDERCRLDYVLKLRKGWSTQAYTALIEQSKAAAHGTPSTWQEAAEVERGTAVYPWFSFLERGAQKLLWRTVGAIILARNPAVADAPAEQQDDLPGYYTAHDIHIQPGGVWSDPRSAEVYELGARIVMLRDNDGYRFHRLFTSTAISQEKLDRIVDMGCGFGKSTLALAAAHPEAETIGIDLSAANIALAKVRASEAGQDVRYRVGDARSTGVEADSVDLVSGTMLLHEMPVDVIAASLAEAARILKPGGEAHFLEFALTGDPLRDATVIEHGRRLNEPFMPEFLLSDWAALCERAGLVDPKVTPFDEREHGLSPEGWGNRPEWHFPWAVLSARSPNSETACD